MCSVFALRRSKNLYDEKISGYFGLEYGRQHLDFYQRVAVESFEVGLPRL